MEEESTAREAELAQRSRRCCTYVCKIPYLIVRQSGCAYFRLPGGFALMRQCSASSQITDRCLKHCDDNRI